MAYMPHTPRVQEGQPGKSGLYSSAMMRYHSPGGVSSPADAACEAKDDHNITVFRSNQRAVLRGEQLDHGMQWKKRRFVPEKRINEGENIAV